MAESIGREITVDKIKIENLNFSYNNEVHIFEGTELTLQRGRIYLLTGNNGTGKSTLMRLLSGLISDGKTYNIQWYDEKAERFNQLKNKMMYIKETPYLYDYLTGAENLELLAEVLEVGDKSKIYENVRIYHLDKDLDKLVKEYSLGMRYKLFLCVAFSMKVELMLLDEPFSSLDNKGQKDAEKMLRDYVNNGGIAMIATHIEEYINRYKQYQYNIEERKLVYYEG